jgi:hypothetical protein
MRRVVFLSLLVLSLSFPLAAAPRRDAPNRDPSSPIERFMRAVTRIVHALDLYDITVPKP